MRLNPPLLSPDELLVATCHEFDRPPGMLPPSTVVPALLDRRGEVAQWAHQQLSGEFRPTPEEIVSVNKGGHGVRPVAIWDLPSRLMYRALVAQLQEVLPRLNRSRERWRSFERLPLDHEGCYVITADIAACYQYIDHGLLSEELLVQGADQRVVDTLMTLLSETSAQSYGLPQQSRASDVLAEVFLDRLERALLRRGLCAFRYNDDFRFSCRSWSEVIRAIEVLSEEARISGLTLNDYKTTTWGHAHYKDHLDRADALRQEIADEAELDLTAFDIDDYDNSSAVPPADEAKLDTATSVGLVAANSNDDSTGDLGTNGPAVNPLASARVLERWESIVRRRGKVPTRRQAEHQVVRELLRPALTTLGTVPTSDREILTTCIRLLRYERTITPAVGRYLRGREDEGPVLDAFDGLLRSRAYVNGWQTWWLQHALAYLPGFGTVGHGAKRRLRWARTALDTAGHAPVLQAHAAITLARHRHIQCDELLSIYARSSATVRPVLAAAIALLAPSANIARAVKDDSTLHKWIYNHTELDA